MVVSLFKNYKMAKVLNMENTQQIQTAELNTSTYELIPAPEIKPEKYGYKIVNVVASGILKLKENSSIDFDCLEKLFDVKRMNQFPSIIYKLGVVSIILFKNGKMIITGIRDINQITGLKEIIETDLQEKGIKFDEFNIKIENLIAMTQLEKIIDLEMLCLKMNNVLYDPQQFSGAIIQNALKL